MKKNIWSLLCLLLAPALMNAEDNRTIRELPEDTILHMERQRTFVADLAEKESLANRLTGTAKDLDLLQEILDAKLIHPDQTWQLQALGVVFGDALIAILPNLRWKEISDQWGTDPVLFYEDTSWQLNALTMISKRVEEGEDLNVRALAGKLVEVTTEKATATDQRTDH